MTPMATQTCLLLLSLHRQGCRPITAAHARKPSTWEAQVERLRILAEISHDHFWTQVFFFPYLFSLYWKHKFKSRHQIFMFMHFYWSGFGSKALLSTGSSAELHPSDIRPLDHATWSSEWRDLWLLCVHPHPSAFSTRSRATTNRLMAF